jgi:hypothetical protein
LVVSVIGRSLRVISSLTGGPADTGVPGGVAWRTSIPRFSSIQGVRGDDRRAHGACPNTFDVIDGFLHACWRPA